MNRLRLTFACWDYDRMRALADGTVRPDGIDLVYLAQPVEETFFRVHRHPGIPVALLPAFVHLRIGEERHPQA